MKTKSSKLFLLTSTFLLICTTTLTSCSTNGSNDIVYCELVKELKPYNDLKVTASVKEDNQNYVNATFTNNGNQYVPIYTFDSEYCDTNDVIVGDFYPNQICPFQDRYIAPNESFSLAMNYYPYQDQEDCVNKINNKNVRTCYYTSEYTGMKFSNLKIKIISKEERKEKHLSSDAYLYYKSSGKFKDGDNYHLLINFNFKGKTYTVISDDPEYEIHAFALHLEHTYYMNHHNFPDPEGYYKDFTIEDKDFSVNWVKCYTAWFRNKQPEKCRDVWRCYEDKTARFFQKLFIGIGIGLIILIPFVAVFLLTRRKKKGTN